MSILIKGVAVSNSERIKLRDGNVVLYKRDDSPKWQATFKLSAGKWHRISTKSTSPDDAAIVACTAYDRARFRETEGLPPVSRRFSDASKLTIRQMENAVKAGHGKTTYRDYKQVIEKYLNPFFGKYHVDKITQEVIEKFEAWRLQKMGRPPAKSTLNNHNSALNKVFETAMGEGWVVKKHVPNLKNRGQAAERRPAFSEAEWDQIVTKFPAWIKATNDKKSIEMRELLFSYIKVLAFSGIRTGTESDNLKWSHLSWHIDAATGQRFLVFSLDGKVGQRIAIAGNECIVALQQIQKRFPALAKHSFDELIDLKIDEPIFRTRSGNTTKNLSAAFNKYLTAHGLLKDVHGKNRTLYSIRHTYATVRLVQGKASVHELSKQMGTSIGMIEHHYDHTTTLMVAAKFSGKKLPANVSTKRQVGQETQALDKPEQGETLEEYEARNPGDPYDTV